VCSSSGENARSHASAASAATRAAARAAVCRPEGEAGRGVMRGGDALRWRAAGEEFASGGGGDHARPGTGEPARSELPPMRRGEPNGGGAALSSTPGDGPATRHGGCSGGCGGR
jgi:hypothetical protein